VVRRSSGGGGSRGLAGGIFKMVSKDTLMIAGGAVLASFGTGIILNKIGSKLPGMGDTVAPATKEKVRAVYSALIPIAAGYALRNKQRQIAEGLVIGGIIMGFNSLIRSFGVGTGTAVVQGPMGNFMEVSKGLGLAGEVPLMGGMSEYVSGANPGTLQGDLSTQVFDGSAW
jgi:hypothetical protein